jgi:hypothetical protein
MGQRATGVNQKIERVASLCGYKNIPVGFALVLNPCHCFVHLNFCPRMNGFVTQVSIKMQTVACESVEVEMEGFSRWKKNPHVIQVVELEAVGELEVIIQPSVIIEVRKGPNNLTPVRNAFTALCRISNN